MSLQDTEIKVSKTLTQLLEIDRGVTGGGYEKGFTPLPQINKSGAFLQGKSYHGRADFSTNGSALSFLPI